MVMGLSLCNNFTEMKYFSKITKQGHCMKSSLIRSYSGPYFPAFGLNKYFYVKYLCCYLTDNYSRNLQASNCAKVCQLNRAEPQDVKNDS